MTIEQKEYKAAERIPMSVEISKTGPTITAADIAAFESRIGHELPADYRKFLLKYNGGRPGHNVVRGEERNDVAVQIFFGIRDHEYYDLDAQWRMMRGRVLDDQLAIAIDGFGNLICLALEDDDYGTVYFWDHECEADEGEEPSYDNLTRLASSFTDFWVRMEPFDPKAFLAELDRQDPPE